MAARHLESNEHGRTLPAILTIMAILTNLYLVIAIIVSSHSITSTYYGTLKPTHGKTFASPNDPSRNPIVSIVSRNPIMSIVSI